MATVEFPLHLHKRFLGEKHAHDHFRVLAAFARYFHSYKMNLCRVNILTDFFICTSRNDLIISTYVTIIVFY